MGDQVIGYVGKKEEKVLASNAVNMWLSNPNLPRRGSDLVLTRRYYPLIF